MHVGAMSWQPPAHKCNVRTGAHRCDHLLNGRLGTLGAVYRQGSASCAQTLAPAGTHLVHAVDLRLQLLQLGMQPFFWFSLHSDTLPTLTAGRKTGCGSSC
jgi:hypothetical protein